MKNIVLFLMIAVLCTAGGIVFYYIKLDSYDPGQLISYRPQLFGKPYQGEADAPITIVVYTRFDCDGCREFHKTIYPLLINEYVAKGKARYYHEHLLFEEDLDGSSELEKAKMLKCLETSPAEYWAAYNALFNDSVNVSGCSIDDGQIRAKISADQFYGLYTVPTVFIGIDNQDLSRIVGIPSITAIQKIIKTKEIILGIE